MRAMVVTRRYEIDMGHCLPTHAGKCYRPHGHRYVVEAVVSLESGTTSRPGQSSDGMIADFADIKRLMADVLEPWDHRFVCSTADPRFPALVSTFDHGDVISVPFTPTAEHLAVAWGEELADELSNLGLELEEITVHETPNARATYRPAP